MTEVLLWLCIIVVIYVYFVYPLFILILSKCRPAPHVLNAHIRPDVSLIITAYNEEKVISQKIDNSLLLDYPSEDIEIIVVSDGSTDSTNEIVRGYRDQGVKLVSLETNQGKSAAQNCAMAEAHGEIIIFTDADVLLQHDAIRKVIRNFADSAVGCTIGKISYTNIGDTPVSEGEGIYWRYEQFLREKESEAGNFSMGSGFMAIRRTLLQPINPDVGEDFVLPMQAVISGFRVIYESEAVSETILHQSAATDMFRTKVRVISKDLRGLLYCRSILNPIRYPLYSWGLISHKLLRWLVPYFLIIIFITNLLLLHMFIYIVIFIVQMTFYLSALICYISQKYGKSLSICKIPFSFCLVNIAALVGVARFFMGKKSGQWEPVRR
ncbi:glycosyltransferase family 2 protein [Gemmatimonadota bacterium]